MRKTLILLSCLSVYHITSAQISAVTSKGDEVVLYANGTWKYTNKTEAADTKIETNKTAFLKNKDASFKVASNNLDNITIFLNPKKWSFKKAEAGEAAEYTFEAKEKEAYGILITEKTEVPLETLKGIALENAKAAAPDVRIIKQEYRIVNGLKMLYLQMQGTVQGIDISYCNYYYSSSKGTVQFLTYCGATLLPQYKGDLEELLNGLSAN